MSVESNRWGYWKRSLGGMLSPFLCVPLAGALAACSGGITIPDGAPTQDGVVIERDGRGALGYDRPTIWVKEDLDETCGIVYYVAPETAIVSHIGGTVRPATVEDLTVGTRVRVWTDAVAESCPGQAVAEEIVIVGVLQDVRMASISHVRALSGFSERAQ